MHHHLKLIYQAVAITSEDKHAFKSIKSLFLLNFNRLNAAFTQYFLFFPLLYKFKNSTMSDVKNSNMDPMLHNVDTVWPLCGPGPVWPTCSLRVALVWPPCGHIRFSTGCNVPLLGYLNGHI